MVQQEVWTTGLDVHMTQALLRHILDWRWATICWLRNPSGHPALSQNLVHLLLWAFGEQPLKNLDSRPYKLQGFPPDLRMLDQGAVMTRWRMVENLQAVLLWRARLVDFLADVWDTLGTPLFDMEECRQATDLFMPGDFTGTDYCPLCLQMYPVANREEEAHQHYERCPVQPMLGEWEETE
jgi:hypothetical protein